MSLSSFQQAVLKNINDRAAQLQKHVENVIREGTAHSSRHPFRSHGTLRCQQTVNYPCSVARSLVRCLILPTTPLTIAGLEHDLEIERRKAKDLQDQLREKDKEYTKLKVYALATMIIVTR